MKICYKFFNLETLEEENQFKIYWKIISEHNFKKINNQNLEVLNYIKQMLNFNFRRVSNIFEKSKSAQLFWKDFNNILDDNYIEKTKKIFNKKQTNLIKRLFITWNGLGSNLKSIKKHKKIKKFFIKNKIINKKQTRSRKNVLKQTNNKKQAQYLQMIEEQQQKLDEIIDQIYKTQQQNKQKPSKHETIDMQIQRLQKQLIKNQLQQRSRLSVIEQNINKQNQANNSSLKHDQYDIKCFQWLINNLQNKQMAQSITKMNKCQRILGQYKFSCSLQNAMGLNQQYYQEKYMEKIDNLRQYSLFKFYKTGVKSLYSYTCNNRLGLIDMCHNRMNLSKFKDKNYFQSSKKMNNTNIKPQIQNQINSLDACHQCKILYPSYLLQKCKFKSQRISSCKVIQSQYQPCLPSIYDCKQQNSTRSSQRFLAKQNNYNSYAKIDDEYVCGRFYCKACLKDHYGKDWQKLNNKVCPFCEGICNCTRCLRNQKINKLKIYFNHIGGNSVKLQQKSQFDRLFEQSLQNKSITKLSKTKLINKSFYKKSKYNNYKEQRIKLKKVLSKQLDEQQTSKSNNSERQLLNMKKYKSKKHRSLKFY